MVVAIDFSSNMIELLMRGLLLGTNVFHLNEWFLLASIAVVRSYFIIGLFSSISVGQMRVLHAEQEMRIEQMLNVGTGLYGETFYLKKSMDTIERITANSFDLYHKLKEENLYQFSGHALGISQQIHEVKKDSQRILAGLLKLYDTEIVVEMNLEEILHFVVKGNQQYSKMLKKKIVIEQQLEVNYFTSHYIPLVTVLNNLVSNAVEAIEKNGKIKVRVVEEEQHIIFSVMDSGKGIPAQDNDIIFEPGFTTKFSDEGIAATGIGLSHVRDIVCALDGEIVVEKSEEAGGAKFVVRFPVAGIIQGREVDVAFFRNSG
jgi:two-component system sensor histidine kinase YcbA